MSEKYITAFYHEYPKSSDDNSITSYLSNHIRKQIRETKKINDEEKDILLNWPIVYAHAWRIQSGEIRVYVGETNDLAQRIGQHARVDQFFYDETDWHEDWIEAIKEGRAFSWFFGSKEMNKSMCLDLEQSLVSLLWRSNVDVKTKAVTEQTAYSNKELRDTLLKEIWEQLVDKIKLTSYDKLDLTALIKCETLFESYSDSLECRCIKPNRNGEFQEIFDREDPFKAYPMVYLYLWKTGVKTFTYVGETEHFDRRNKQHLSKREDAKAWQNEWKNASKNKQAYLFIFNHREFNKSMTLDIENRLINYTTFIKTSRNLRHNEQGQYNNKEKMFDIFKKIIEGLLVWQTQNKEYQVFKALETVREQCISLASPFYELTTEQSDAKMKILEKINEALDNEKPEHTLLVVYGGAGTGKTVLISALLFSLIDAKASCKLVVNNKELAPAYQNMIDIWKLGSDTPEKGKDIVYYASDYLKEREEHDVVLVDEGHLLNTVANQQAKPQLDIIINKAKVTVLVFDPLQFIDKFKKWEGDFSSSEKVRDAFVALYKNYGVHNLKVCSYELKEQQRMRCALETQEWILKLTEMGAEIGRFPVMDAKKSNETADKKVVCVEDEKDYFIAICKEPQVMQKFVQNKRKEDKESLMIATYDWAYDRSSKHTIFLPNDKKPVLSLRWHKTGSGANTKDKSDALNLDSWIKQADCNEVGSVHDIQGFDLNYACVIIGPSIQYSPRRGQDKHIEPGVQVNTKEHKTNHDAQIILNELRVLLTRGSKGLIIYAVDKKLREALYNALKGEG